ncbi:MAG: PA2779 family protein [Pseudomonadota bacterium]
MTFKGIAKRIFAVGIAAQLLIATQFATMAQAEMIGTQAAIQAEIADMNRAQMLDGLQRKDVQAELIRLGIDPSEAEQRLAALSDAEIQKTLMQMEDGSAGADIFGTIAFVFIVLLVTDLLCLTRIFSFTRCAR